MRDTNPAPAAPAPDAPPDEAMFASGPLLAVLLDALHEAAPTLVPDEVGPIDDVRRARGPLALKRELLGRADRALGPVFLLDVGRRLDKFQHNPLLETFVRSETVDVFVDKWMRFERYGHAVHRTRRTERGPSRWCLQHYATSGPEPGSDHDLFILGIVIGILERAGYPGLRVSLLPDERLLYADGERCTVEPELLQAPTNHWCLEASGPRATLDITTPSETIEAPESALYALLADDPARAWSLAEAARTLGYSSRSLQRHLAAADASFSKTVRGVRVNEACRLLETTTHSITEIGYLCGFTDAAQFARDFRASVGTPPSAFRNALASATIAAKRT